MIAPELGKLLLGQARATLEEELEGLAQGEVASRIFINQRIHRPPITPA